jgi:hypothetical protein
VTNIINNNNINNYYINQIDPKASKLSNSGIKASTPPGKSMEAPSELTGRLSQHSE